METRSAAGDVCSQRSRRGGKAALGFAISAGMLALWATASARTQGESPPAQPAPDVPAPPPAFQECAICHGAAPDAPPAVGPNLWNVGGRKAGASDYPYSPAMKASGIVWTTETLQAYIANPKNVVPGTLMEYPGLSDPTAARGIADYLMTLRD